MNRRGFLGSMLALPLVFAALPKEPEKRTLHVSKMITTSGEYDRVVLPPAQTGMVVTVINTGRNWVVVEPCRQTEES